ncbi:sulfate/thiosulfate import ATP-binding protein CysA [bacterium BMS3Abin01]|nr:sulfate/thiosulfate import ATP-binding protein CysA [bacterium BMS3Abin01]HDY69898.1 ABC transporter ATP-binding protein [Actinomycetota bacterium]
MSAVLVASGLKRRYDGRVVLDVGRLALRRGETFCIMGANGAGKSTLLRLLNLVEDSDGGEIRFNGKRVDKGSIWARRRMAGVFQRPFLFKGSVADNVAYGLRLRRLPRCEMSRRLEQVLEDFSLTELAQRNARKLSGGQAQRVALARAVAVEPDVLFLDEPAAGLDPLVREEFQLDLRHTIEALKTTVAYVTHSLADAAVVADRLAVMNEGKFCQVGPVAEIINAPADIFSARLLGFENLLAGRATGIIDGGAVVKLEAAKGHSLRSATAAAGLVAACIRGEDITLHPFPRWDTAGRVNRFTAVVESIAYASPAHKVTIDCGFKLVAVITRPEAVRLGLAPGVKVEARISPAAVRLVRAGKGSFLEAADTGSAVAPAELPGATVSHG